MPLGKVCPKCGKENVADASWCEKCLTVFREYAEDKTIMCPECNEPNSYLNDHCEACHEPLKPGQWE